uniref:Uncharacterized protein n=1 Tax=Anguilla anguilla TaxID=7936 RepID=A0A0E9QB38_ANGAN
MSNRSRTTSRCGFTRDTGAMVTVCISGSYHSSWHRLPKSHP